MDRWKQSMHEFIVIAWLPEYSSWSITWHSAVRNSIQREYYVKISEAILTIEDWMTWRSETLDDCWLPNSWSLALLDSWSKASNVGTSRKRPSRGTYSRESHRLNTSNSRTVREAAQPLDASQLLLFDRTAL
jgi:hypothetical protein